MTLVVLLFGTLFADDVFVVQASFPVARFGNGTVGLKNDGGVVQVQSTDFVVDGNMHVSGVLTVQGQDISKYEERVSHLETALGVNVTSSEPASVVSQLQSLMPPSCMSPGGKALFSDGTSWICECVQNSTHVYYGTSCESLSSSVAMIGGKELYQDSDGWILLLAYNHKAGVNNALVSKTAPSSPTEGYSHVWLEDLGLTASDVESVKFYCKTSAHSRVMHFSSSTDWVKNAIVTGTYAGNQVSYWTSGTTKFSDHTANLPDATDLAGYNDLTNAIFYLSNTYHWGMKIQGSRWECDDFARNTADTLHQIWFKRKPSGTYAVTIDGVSTDIYHDHETAGGGWMSFASVPSTGGFFGGDTGNADWSTSSYSYGTYDASGAVGDYWRDISKQSVSEILFRTGDGMYWIVMKLSDISTTGVKTLVASSGNFEESKEENTKAYVLRRSYHPEDPWINAGNSHNGGVGAEYIVNYMFWGEAGYDAAHTSFKNDHGGVLVFVR